MDTWVFIDKVFQIPPLNVKKGAIAADFFLKSEGLLTRGVLLGKRRYVERNFGAVLGNPLCHYQSREFLF